MNTIVVAALALLVLAIVSLLFIGRMNASRQGFSDCEARGGYCINELEYGGDCERAMTLPRFSQYTRGIRRPDVCFNARGEPNDAEMCCVFS